MTMLEPDDGHEHIYRTGPGICIFCGAIDAWEPCVPPPCPEPEEIEFEATWRAFE